MFVLYRIDEHSDNFLYIEDYSRCSENGEKNENSNKKIGKFQV